MNERVMQYGVVAPDTVKTYDGLSFASCEFTRHNVRTNVAHSAQNSHQPLGLRPSFTADNR